MNTHLKSLKAEAQLRIASLGLLFLKLLSLTLSVLVNAGVAVPAWATSAIHLGQYVGIGLVVLFIVRLVLAWRED